MASADLYGGLATFLAADVLATVNAEFPALLKTGSVYVARANRGRGPRRINALPLGVELVNVTGPRDKAIGTDVILRASVWEMTTWARRKATSEGAALNTNPQKILRSLRRRYEDVSNLSLTITGATFVVSNTDVLEVDADPESSELEVARLRATFLFKEVKVDT